MLDYRRMGITEPHLGNTMLATSMHHLRDLWKSPRGTVLRIQALAVVAIIISFLLAAFGSCRRWSNSWIVQKGFFAAHVLSLSLGTYSIGLMQSSLVKSEMYPIWTVSLFTLFGCIDPVTSYNGLDYKGPLSKVAYGICLNFGYVLLMSISTISSGVSNTAICMLSAITFIKGFHRSLALVQQSRMRNMVQDFINDEVGGISVLRIDDYSVRFRLQRDVMIVDFGTGINGSTDHVNMSQINWLLSKHNDELSSCYDVCVAFSLSHKLQRHFLGLGYRMPDPETLKNIDYKWALKVTEIELAFLYDIFFSGNAFLHYYQAKTASLWALASFIGICFVGVAAAIPGTMSSRHTTSDPGGCTNVVDTTTIDFVVTLVILVSLALLQLMHLIWCWTSNWARVAVACAYARNYKKKGINVSKEYEMPYWWRRWMRLKVFVATSTNRLDKYLWQDKIGQYSILPELRLTRGKKGEGSNWREFSSLNSMVGHLYQQCSRLAKMLGLDYIGEVLWDLLGSDTHKRAAVRLDDDVKASIIHFLGQIETDILDGSWLSFPKHPAIKPFLPYYEDSVFKSKSHGYRYTSCVMMWHIVTLYCELAEKQDALSKAEERICCRETAVSYLKKAVSAVASGCFKKAAPGGGEREENRNRHVAKVLSKYCAFLVVSAPELLPQPASETKRAYNSFAELARVALNEHPKKKMDKLLAARSETIWTNMYNFTARGDEFSAAVGLAELLLDDPWETLALVWVRMLVYAAPYGNVQAHMRQLSQGGEFITHLWALLYHLDISEWKQWKLPENLHNITTIEDADRILGEYDQAVVAYLDSLSGSDDSNELAIASRILENGVRFYQTSNPDVARLLHIYQRAPPLVLLNKEKFTLYYGRFYAYDIVRFVSAKLATAKQARAEETTAPSIFDNPIKKQSLEDGGQTGDGIEEEIHPDGCLFVQVADLGCDQTGPMPPPPPRSYS